MTSERSKRRDFLSLIFISKKFKYNITGSNTPTGRRNPVGYFKRGRVLVGSKGRMTVTLLPGDYQCGPGSNPGFDAICGKSLLLVLSFAPPRGFSPGTPVFSFLQKPTFPNSNLTRNQVDKEPLCGYATSKSL